MLSGYEAASIIVSSDSDSKAQKRLADEVDATGFAGMVAEEEETREEAGVEAGEEATE